MMYHFGGPLDDILHDLNAIKAAEELGLILNNSKSNAVLRDTVITAIPGALVVDPDACPLGSSLDDFLFLNASLDEKIEALMGAQFVHLSAHDSLFLL